MITTLTDNKKLMNFISGGEIRISPTLAMAIYTTHENDSANVTPFAIMMTIILLVAMFKNDDKPSSIHQEEPEVSYKNLTLHG